MITGKRAEVSGPEAGFRREVRAWLEGVLPSDWGARHRPASTLAGRTKEGKAWQRMVYQGGFGDLGLPVQFGGSPASFPPMSRTPF